MDLKRAMASNVRRERHARRLTQEELADRPGLSARYLGSIERGTVSASVTVLGRLAEALRIDPCDLIRKSHRRLFSGSADHTSGPPLPQMRSIGIPPEENASVSRRPKSHTHTPVRQKT